MGEKNPRLYYRAASASPAGHSTCLKAQHIHIQPKAWVVQWKSWVTLAVFIIYYPLYLSLPIKSHILI